MLKTCVAGAIALALSSAQQVPASTTYTSHPYIERVDCEEGKGTAFKLDTGEWVSVAHVASMSQCKIDGLPVHVTFLDGLGDFALLDVPGDHRRGGIHVDCSGYHDREWYWAEGHARGDPYPEVIPVMYSEIITDAQRSIRGWATLIYNRFIPGMSGGPVLNARGEVVGTVNAFAIYRIESASKPLSETPLCQK